MVRGAIAVVFLGLTASIAAQTPRPAEKHTVLSNGHPLAVWSRTPANPRAVLVLVHGRTWSSRPDFDLQVPGLQRSVLSSLAAQGVAAYAVDLRGYGDTPRDKTEFLTPRVAAQDVAAVVHWAASRHAALPPPSLLGWSLGGAVAQLAAQMGTRLSSLVLFGFTMEPGVDYAAVPAPAKPPRVKTTRADAMGDFISPLVTPPAVTAAFMAQALATDPVRMDWIKEDEFNALDPARLLVPTMILQGSRDPGVPVDVTARFFQKIASPHRQWTLLPGGDHAAQLEDTHAAFIAAVVEFITRPGPVRR